MRGYETRHLVDKLVGSGPGNVARVKAADISQGERWHNVWSQSEGLEMTGDRVSHTFILETAQELSLVYNMWKPYLVEIRIHHEVPNLMYGSRLWGAVIGFENRNESSIRPQASIPPKDHRIVWSKGIRERGQRPQSSNSRAVK